MKIIIVGAGTVGTVICTQLATEGHDITVIDQNISVLAELSNRYDVIGIEGNGASVSTLRKAGADKAELLIAVTNLDELNILCCASAKKLGISYLVGTVATGDKFISDKSDKDVITERFGAVACEMEGGAIAHTAFVNDTPCMVVRAISDSADGDACMDYPTFLPIATKASTSLTLALIEEY
jgi:nucleoside phosphorylase